MIWIDYQRAECCIEIPTIWARFTLTTTGRICLKSPPKTTHTDLQTLPHIFLKESQQSYQEDKNTWGIPGNSTWKTRIPGEFLVILPRITRNSPGILMSFSQDHQKELVLAECNLVLWEKCQSCRNGSSCWDSAPSIFFYQQPSQNLQFSPGKLQPRSTGGEVTSSKSQELSENKCQGRSCKRTFQSIFLKYFHSSTSPLNWVNLRSVFRCLPLLFRWFSCGQLFDEPL